MDKTDSRSLDARSAIADPGTHARTDDTNRILA
jgi:hypothetical protein